MFPNSLVSTEGISTFQALLNKCSLVFGIVFILQPVGDPDSISSGLLVGTVLITLGFMVGWRAMWRSVAERCVDTLLKSNSCSSRSIMLRGVGIVSEEEEAKFVDDLANWKTAATSVTAPAPTDETPAPATVHSSAIVGSTLAYNIADEYGTLVRYLGLCRELERIDKYRSGLSKGHDDPKAEHAVRYQIEGAYPPGMMCASRIIVCAITLDVGLYYDKLNMEVEYLDRRVATMRSANLQAYDRTGFIFVTFRSSQCNVCPLPK